jgi:hypothetical protein
MENSHSAHYTRLFDDKCENSKSIIIENLEPVIVLGLALVSVLDVMGCWTFLITVC